MSHGLLGQKIGMTRLFNDDGTSIAVSVLLVINNRVVQVKTENTDGYSAIQVAFGKRKVKRVNNPLKGHYAKAGVESGSFLREFRFETDDELKDFTVGSVIALDTFKVDDLVDVTGKSKGKGFTGTIKRWNFSSNRASHGNSKSHNVPGSIGQRQDPGRVFPGKKMCGHLGDVKVTIQNLKIKKIDAERALLLVEGAVPGSRGGYVIIKPSVKAAV